MEDTDEVMMFVYFKYGQYSSYRVKYSIAKWAIGEFYAWFPKQNEEKDKVIKFAEGDDLEAFTGFFLLSQVAAISTAVVDREQQLIEKSMKMKQLDLMRKSEKFMDDCNEDDKWKKDE